MNTAVKTDVEKIVRHAYRLHNSLALTDAPNLLVVAEDIARLRDNVQRLLDTVNHQIDAQQYASPLVPEGYSTVLAYVHDEYPDWLARQDAPASSTSKMGKHCTHIANKLGLDYVDVAAPEVLRTLGINTVRAYPKHVVALVVDTELG